MLTCAALLRQSAKLMGCSTLTAFLFVTGCRSNPPRDAAGELRKLSKPPTLSSETRGTSPQVLELINQAQSVAEFIASKPPDPQLKEAVFLLDSTQQQIALASSQINLGLIGGPGSLAEAGQFPYQVAIILSNYFPSASRGYHCGGTLIAPDWVMTAGHCFDDDSSEAEVKVYAGHLKLSESTADCKCWYDVRKLYRHPEFKLRPSSYGQTIDGDIALLQLKEHVTTPGVTPIGLASPGAEAYSSKAHLATISGWGKATSSPTSLSDTLRFGTVRIVPGAACLKAYGPGVIAADMLCATAYPVDACSGDSGGALVSRPQGDSDANSPPLVEGVVSWTYPAGGCPSLKPTVYAKLPSSVIYNWIDGCLHGLPCPSSIKEDQTLSSNKPL